MSKLETVSILQDKLTLCGIGQAACRNYELQFNICECASSIVSFEFATGATAVQDHRSQTTELCKYV